MITVFRKENVYIEDEVKNDEKEIELRGLSTDTKPTTINGEAIANGTLFIEINTGKIFIYDLSSETWKEM